VPSNVQKLIKVTFTDRFGDDMIDGLLESDFIGMGTVYRRDERRVLFVRPNMNAYQILIEQLTAWKEDGLLTFVEESR
jgi:hypothetical protein